MKGFLKVFLISIIVLVIAAFLVKGWIVEAIVGQAVTKVTGFDTQIKDIKYHYPSTLLISGLLIENPKGFEKPVFVEMPEIFVDLNLDPLLKKEKIHLREVRLNLSEVNIEKNKEGVSNVQLMTAVAGGAKKDAPKAEPAKQPEKGPAMPFQLDKLDLTIRKVSYSDKSSVIPQNLSADLNVDHKIIEGIGDPKALVSIILLEIMKGTTFGNLMNLSPDFLENSMKDGFAKGQALMEASAATLSKEADKALAEAQKRTKESLSTLNEATGGLTDKAGDALKGSAEGASEKLSDVADSAKDQLGGMFSKIKSTVSQESK